MNAALQAIKAHLLEIWPRGAECEHVHARAAFLILDAEIARQTPKPLPMAQICERVLMRLGRGPVRACDLIPEIMGCGVASGQSYFAAYMALKSLVEAGKAERVVIGAGEECWRLPSSTLIEKGTE